MGISNILAIPEWVSRYFQACIRLEEMGGSYEDKPHYPGTLVATLFGEVIEFARPSFPEDYEKAADILETFCRAHEDAWHSKVAQNWVGL